MNHQDELPLAKVSEVDEAKRQWLQGMRHPVDTVTEAEPAEILAEFIRQHSVAGTPFPPDYRGLASARAGGRAPCSHREGSVF